MEIETLRKHGYLSVEMCENDTCLWLIHVYLILILSKRGSQISKVNLTFTYMFLSGYHADTPITIKAEAIHEAESRIH